MGIRQAIGLGRELRAQLQQADLSGNESVPLLSGEMHPSQVGLHYYDDCLNYSGLLSKFHIREKSDDSGSSGQCHFRHDRWSQYSSAHCHCTNC